MVEKKKITKKQPNWRFSRSRQESLKRAQKIHVILINIGKEYRNKAIQRSKYRRLLGKSSGKKT